MSFFVIVMLEGGPTNLVLGFPSVLTHFLGYLHHLPYETVQRQVGEDHGILANYGLVVIQAVRVVLLVILGSLHHLDCYCMALYRLFLEHSLGVAIYYIFSGFVIYISSLGVSARPV